MAVASPAAACAVAAPPQPQQHGAPRLTALVRGLPSTVPFVGPEAQ
eukprot:COSAG01_NODE_42115_length_443_cov_1.459302_1_plen_45_part_01